MNDYTNDGPEQPVDIGNEASWEWSIGRSGSLYIVIQGPFELGGAFVFRRSAERFIKREMKRQQRDPRWRKLRTAYLERELGFGDKPSEL